MPKALWANLRPLNLGRRGGISACPAPPVVLEDPEPERPGAVLPDAAEPDEAEPFDAEPDASAAVEPVASLGSPGVEAWAE